MPELEDRIKSLALELGFDRVGIADAGPFVRDERRRWNEHARGLMDGLPGTRRSESGA